jgi:DNA (cytosine-5)-methyltransferase 1
MALICGFTEKIMNYISVCSGIEAATVAWHQMGWSPIAFSEIEPFPSAVLTHHYPDVPNVGDMTKYKEWNFGPKTVDLLVGGTPCQSFSVAGLRKGLEDPRGNLALIYCGILDWFRPQWFVWENVPGVLSSSGGRDFGSFLGALAELGYGFAYRVLDAQYFGVAQRRRRVFVVGYLGDWRPAAEVLFERESLRGDPAPSRETRKATAVSAARCFDRQSSGEYGTAPVASTISARDYKSPSDLIQPITAPTLTASNDPSRSPQSSEVTNQVAAVLQASMAVRRLTPVECERLQGFPDNYTNIPWRKSDESPDGPRYKALGNSMAVPVMGWIGNRIHQWNEKTGKTHEHRSYEVGA